MFESSTGALLRMPEENAAVPTWSDDDLRAAVHANFGLGSESDLDDPLRFLLGVARTIRRRQQEAGVRHEEIPAVFFLHPYAPQTLAPTDFEVRPMLDNGLTTLGGSFWFVGPTVAQGLGLEVADWSDDAEIFRKATTELCIGNVPAVFFDTRTKTPHLRHYPSGLGNANDVAIAPLGGETIDVDRIFQVVDDEYATHLASPGGGARLWKKSAKHWVADDAEKSIQFALKVALHHALPTVIVREEQTQASGRLDLEIEEPLMQVGKFVRHAILELKVLRSFGSTGSPISDSEIRKIVKDGVEQAFSYRTEREANASALCCFDMRMKTARRKCFHGVQSTAKKRKVRLCVWPIFASAREYRECNS